jgi:hypothetical protein
MTPLLALLLMLLLIAGCATPQGIVHVCSPVEPQMMRTIYPDFDCKKREGSFLILGGDYFLGYRRCVWFPRQGFHVAVTDYMPNR